MSYRDKVQLVIKCNRTAADSMIPLLKEFRKMGSLGASRAVNIEDWDGEHRFGFDGDGPDNIESIELDGKLIKAKDLAEHLREKGLHRKGHKMKVDPKEMDMGIEVEMEHTDNKDVAREIALDHLHEDPKYYSKLKRMEANMKKAYEPKTEPGEYHDKPEKEVMLENLRAQVRKLKKKKSNRGILAQITGLQNKIKKLEGKKVEKSSVPLVIMPKKVAKERVVLPSLLKAGEACPKKEDYKSEFEFYKAYRKWQAKHGKGVTAKKSMGLSKPTAKHPAKLKGATDQGHPASLSAAKPGRMETMKRAKASMENMLGQHGTEQGAKDPGVPRKKGRPSHKPPYDTSTGGVSGMGSDASGNAGKAPNVPKPKSIKSASTIRQEKVGTPRVKTKAPSHKKPYRVRG